MISTNFSKYLLYIPALLVVALIYPIGIDTFLFTSGYTSYEIDAPGPEMQLADISSGFSRDDPRRPFPIFHSMVMGVAYVPYIWARTSIMPPYDLKTIDKDFPYLKQDLVILMRLMNIFAAIGIILLSFHITRLFCKSLLPPFLVSLAAAMNPDLMFQSSVTYYENWSIFWVMLSVLCFAKVILGKKNSFLWFSGFFIIAALAVSTHERMFGYYVFASPFLICRFYIFNLECGKTHRKAFLLTLAALIFGATAFCLANNVFRVGVNPIFEYLHFKSAAIKATPERVSGLFAILKNQVRCHLHTLWLVFWNLGGILPLFTLYGVFMAWKKRFYLGLSLLMFPLGYQVLSVGLPGWTSGRYVLGQTIFATIFAGFALVFLKDEAENKSKTGLALVLFTAALFSEFFTSSMVKAADIYYHPYRVIERIVRDPASSGKEIAIQGLMNSYDDLYQRNGVKYKLLTKEDKVCSGADIIISTGEGGCDCVKLHKEVLLRPPALLRFLVRRQCYLYSQGLSTIRIQWCDDQSG